MGKMSDLDIEAQQLVWFLRGEDGREIERLKSRISALNAEQVGERSAIGQALGWAVGLPRAHPDVPELDGIDEVDTECFGPVELARKAASEVARLKAEVDYLERVRNKSIVMINPDADEVARLRNEVERLTYDLDDLATWAAEHLNDIAELVTGTAGTWDADKIREAAGI